MADWQPIDTAPKDGTVIRVKNTVMQEPVQAKFGTYKSDWGKEYPDNWIVTKEEQQFPSGLVGCFVIPTHWQHI